MKRKKTYVLCSKHRSLEAAEKRVAEIKEAGGDAHAAQIVSTEIYTVNVPNTEKKKWCKRYK